MPKVNLSVKMLAYTPEPLKVLYLAFKQCYYNGFVGDMREDAEKDPIPPHEKQAEYIRRIISSGHLSPIEHVSFTFALSGVSRALTHQLVRHRIASYSQQSQRFVDAINFDYIEPDSISSNPDAHKIFTNFMQEASKVYNNLREIIGKNCAGHSVNEDARFVLPNATASRIVISMNCRSLLNFFENRCCRRAQWEIRTLACEMLNQCQSILPEIFENAGAKCKRLGYCPEGNFSCGMSPIKKQADADFL